MRLGVPTFLTDSLSTPPSLTSLERPKSATCGSQEGWVSGGVGMLVNYLEGTAGKQAAARPLDHAASMTTSSPGGLTRSPIHQPANNHDNTQLTNQLPNCPTDSPPPWCSLSHHDLPCACGQEVQHTLELDVIV